MKKLTIGLISLCSLLASQFLAAQTPNTLPLESGDWKVFYSSFYSTDIPAKTAKEYKIVRDRYRGMLNISLQNIHQSTDPLNPISHTATITGTAINLVGQKFQLEFKQINEGKVIYYLSDFRFANEETLRFKLEVTPTGSTSIPLKFSNKFYAQ
ncbi:DUF4426 domain-containing protein [Pelagibaculum spongiae]|uniref:DUF4426 domain-containing protein n=1 Tax=Pelagibaculum spongiae TaxID=2080658 RepID=A0A2V1H6X2_9GAMM|nr:DUF4426 domain-containing protein [Pelagibaculum spongiae]PVZ72182.1 DUF4426 domain-containing protein [Pelagibaculum spongiae]